MSSIKNLYELSKKEKKEVRTLSEHQILQQTLLTMQDQLEALKTSVLHLETLKDAQDQYKTLKTNFNALVDTFNKTTSDIQNVFSDISERINTIESTLGI